ncbi:hypothetical protein MT418_007808 [Batrachochytrium dendrobatidis]
MSSASLDYFYWKLKMPRRILERHLADPVAGTANTSTCTTQHASDQPFVKILYPSKHLPKDTTSMLVLDSSFNPPTKAHLNLMVHTLNTLVGPSVQFDCCLMLLSTVNMDKPFVAPITSQEPQSVDLSAATLSPSTPVLDRLEMMCSLIESIPCIPACHVGLTNQASFIDKLAAIQSSWPSITTVYFIMGCDTLKRFFDTKYYQSLVPLYPLGVSNDSVQSKEPDQTLNIDSCVGQLLAHRFFYQGGRIISASRPIHSPAAVNTECADHTAVIHTSDVITSALKTGTLLPLCQSSIIELVGWSVPESDASTKPLLDLISSSHVRDLFAHYWSIPSNSGLLDQPVPQVAISRSYEDNLIAKLKHLIDETIFEYIVDHHLYCP